MDLIVLDWSFWTGRYGSVVMDWMSWTCRYGLVGMDTWSVWTLGRYGLVSIGWSLFGGFRMCPGLYGLVVN